MISKRKYLRLGPVWGAWRLHSTLQWAAVAIIALGCGHAGASTFVKANVTTLLGPTFFVDDAAPGGTDALVNQPASGTYVRTFGGLLTANQGTTTVNITALNDAPTVTSANTISYTENDAATALNPGIAVADLDNAGLASATVTIAGSPSGTAATASDTATASVTATATAEPSASATAGDSAKAGAGVSSMLSGPGG